jgi:hypothetical protein
MPAATGKRKSKKEVKEDAPEESEAKPIEPIVLQLPISPHRLNELMAVEEIPSVLEYSPTISDPQPYHAINHFVSEHDVVEEAQATSSQDATISHDQGASETANATQQASKGKSSSTCFWCCHLIEHMEFGMPIRYDVCHKSFTTFGCFCSLECVAAYNFSIHMGSDRVWEIHSWIQMLASRYGYEGNIRPAPSRYALQMFNGPLSIEEFRNVHKNLARTCIMNIPPFVHVTSQLEMLNTSFLDSGSASYDPAEKSKTKKRTANAIEKKPIESKLPSAFLTT